MIEALNSHLPSAPAQELYSLLIERMQKNGNVLFNVALELQQTHAEIATVVNLLELKKAGWITYDDSECEYRVIIPLRGVGV